MERTSMYLILVSALLALGQCGCFRENWWSSFDREGISACTNERLIKGFFRGGRQRNDYINLLEEAECCDMTSPWNGNDKETLNADWWLTFDADNKWSECPVGYFLEGLFRSALGFRINGWLHNIEEGICTKPKGHPENYGECYDEDISECFDDKNLCKCNDNFFVTGLYRGGCNYLHCIEKLRCCKMALDSDVINHVTDEVKNNYHLTLNGRIKVVVSYQNNSNVDVGEVTQPPTDEVTEPPTDELTWPPLETEPPTDEVTEPPTDEVTWPPLEENTEPPTDEVTEPPTDELTWPPLEENTEPPTDEVTEPPTDELTWPPLEKNTEPPTDEVTRPPTDELTWPPLEKNTEPPTDENTEPPTDELTWPPLE